MDLINQVATTLEKLISRVPAPFRDAILGAVEQQATSVAQEQISAWLAAAVDPTVKRMQADGWDPVGTRNQAHETPATPQEGIDAAIRTAEYFENEYALIAAGLKDGANVPAEQIRLNEDTAVLAAVRSEITVGMPVAQLVPIVKAAIAKIVP